ncbi:MAG: 3-deoxy-7-phosphoheptulonate synthase [Spirochaetales bacterium]|nr:3-deoxy-7-phosphoheptulonate synthase [Spirochaetales bacterium]
MARNELPSPGDLAREDSLPAASRALVESSRSVVREILAGRDDRLLLLVGPCSIHDPDEAAVYAAKLAELAAKVSGEAYVVARAFVEKSRTSLGWRGLARDPHLDGSRGTGEGIVEARRALTGMLASGVPVAVELVSPFLWPYWIDCVSWAGIGARSVESPSLREATALIPCPVGFKNGLDGDPAAAINAVLSAVRPGTALAIGKDGRLVESEAPGNPAVHVVLRGGRDGPNVSLAPRVAASMEAMGLLPSILVDSSHDNSRKRPERQRGAALKALALRRRGVPIRGIMIESYLKAGRQHPAPRNLLAAGLSVTDACLGWDATERLVLELATRERRIREKLARKGA